MATNIDVPPLYDFLTKESSLHMSNIWVDWWSMFYQTLIGYFSSTGVFLPVLTTAQRNEIKMPVAGQMIYNSTEKTAQYYKHDAWTNF